MQSINFVQKGEKQMEELKDIQAAMCLPVGISSLSPFRSLSICIFPVSHNAFLSFSQFSDKC